MMRELSLDFETASEVDLKQCGTDVYARHPSTRVLMLAYAVDDGAVHQWLPHEGPMPAKLRAALTDPRYLKTAFNATFERAILKHVLGIDSPIEQWEDTMVMANIMALPGYLDGLGKALKLGQDFQKDGRGKALIKYFCQPRKPTKNKPWVWADHINSPAEWKEFCEYNVQDVVVERKARSLLKKYPIQPWEWDDWRLDQKINERGVPVDLELVNQAIKIAKVVREQYKAELIKITGLKNPGSVQQFLPWAQERGYPFSELRKDRIKIALNDFKAEMTPECVKALELRLKAEKSSLKKFPAMLRAQWDGVVRFMFQFSGAGRTGRWAGRIVQLQNLARGLKDVLAFLEDAREMVRAGNIELVSALWDNPLDVLSTLLRSAFCAPDGYKFVIADLSAIESRVIGWLARCETLLDVFRSGRDTYKTFAVHLFGKPYDEITKDERNQSKPAVLGCFAGDTLVLTDAGWLPISRLQKHHRVHDGIEWVEHDGVAFQGRKSVIDLKGVLVTPDHKILTEEGWLPSNTVAQEGRYFQSARRLANGLLLTPSRGLKTARANTSTSVAVPAERFTSTTEATSNAVSLLAACLAPIAGITTRPPSEVVKAMRARLSSACRIAFTRCVLAASAAADPTRLTRAEEFFASSSLLKSSSTTASRSQGTTIPPWKLIGSTQMDTMSRATFASRLGQSKSGTSTTLDSSNTRGFGITALIFTACSALATAVNLRSLVKSAKGCLRSKSSRIKLVAEVDTFDIVNAGPRSRFVVLTNEGPIIVHNCGYRLGGGDLVGEYPDQKKTGLWGYAENMGIELTKDECHRAVAIFREVYPEIVQLWYDLENAVSRVMSGEGPQHVGPVTFTLKAPFLLARLPSGRCLFYCRPKMERKTRTWPDGRKTTKLQLTYEGIHQTTKKWVRMDTHGGKLVENLVQAIANDILRHGLRKADAAGFPIVLHVHDEIGALVCRNDPKLTVHALEACMTDQPEWAKGLPLGAEGFESVFYKKG